MQQIRATVASGIRAGQPAHRGAAALRRTHGGKRGSLYRRRRRQTPAPAAGAAQRCRPGRLRDGHIKFAAIIEFIHTATLLHDDVVDISSLRRGRPTANAEFGNAPSVLVGDFLYTRAFQLMVQLGDMDILRHMADTTNTIAEGEVLQLTRAGDADTTKPSTWTSSPAKPPSCSPRPATAQPRSAGADRPGRHCTTSASTWASPSR